MTRRETPVYHSVGSRLVPCWGCPEHATTPVRGGRVAGGLSRAAVTAGAR